MGALGALRALRALGALGSGSPGSTGSLGSIGSPGCAVSPGGIGSPGKWGWSPGSLWSLGRQCNEIEDMGKMLKSKKMGKGDIGRLFKKSTPCRGIMIWSKKPIPGRPGSPGSRVGPRPTQ